MLTRGGCKRVLVMTAWLAVAPLGCGAFARKAAAPALAVSAEMDRDRYRPGEAVVCTVTVANKGSAAGSVGSLSADTLEFWHGPTETELRYRRDPVRSPMEPRFAPVTIEPGQDIRRRFVLTRATEEEGEFALHALYSPEGNVPGKPGIAAPAVLYQVDGARRFRRDQAGLIRKEDAIEVVRHEMGAELTSAEAKLVRNEAGFLDWWVRAEAKADGQAVRRAFFVNPYTGLIRAEARPEETPLASEPEATKASPQSHSPLASPSRHDGVQKEGK